MSTPKRSVRAPPRAHTPRMSERKKSLFGSGHADGDRRALPALHSESESESEGRSLGVAALDSSSSGDERDRSAPGTPAHMWRETRSRTRRLLKDSQDIKEFIKSPYTLRNYQTRLQNDQKRLTSVSTPATPRVNYPGTPSSTHSTASVGTVASDKSRARKSLASLIADTESCSSSLKDLNFDTDSGTDTKENTPKKEVRKSGRRKTLTPKFATFKGILQEHKKNASSPSMDYTTTEMEKSVMMSPTQMLKTPHGTSEVTMSPPKISHSRRVAIEIEESPDENDRAHKRHFNTSLDSETGPNPKNPKLDTSTGVPKARLSLFNSDKLKELLSTKSFYPKANISHEEVSPAVAMKVSKVIAETNKNQRRSFSHSSHRPKQRRPGQINSGVRHRIRKPKFPKHGHIVKMNMMRPEGLKPLSANASNISVSSQDTSAVSCDQNNTSDMLAYERDKGDPFDKEHRTIDALLSQWTEEEVPSNEPQLNQTIEEAHAKIRTAEALLSFNRSINEENSILTNPNTAVPVESCDISQEGDIVEIGTKHPLTVLTEPISNGQNHMEMGCKELNKYNGILQMTKAQVHHSGDGPKGRLGVRESDDVVMREESHRTANGQPPKGGEFLPVEGGYLLVTDNDLEDRQEDVTDLDEIERELAMLDDQLCSMAKQNNIDPDAILKAPSDLVPATTGTVESSSKMFPIFDKATSVPVPASIPKAHAKPHKKMILKSGKDQYVIDAGQKRFGATQCRECGVIYQIGDPQDEHDHLLHHNAVDVLRFNGWKGERVVGVWGESRCVCVRGGDPRWRRVAALLERVVHPQLGYAGALPRSDQLYAYTAYLYINKKQIVGCLIAEPKEKAHRLLSGDIDCCSEKEYPVKCGVSRLWTHVSWRRRGVASNLLNCARASFLYGEVLAADEMAFSAPTPAGRAFAASYTRRPDFFVYLD